MTPPDPKGTDMTESELKPVSVSSTLETAVHAVLVWHSAEQLQRIEDKLDALTRTHPPEYARLIEAAEAVIRETAYIDGHDPISKAVDSLIAALATIKETRPRPFINALTRNVLSFGMLIRKATAQSVLPPAGLATARCIVKCGR